MPQPHLVVFLPCRLHMRQPGSQVRNHAGRQQLGYPKRASYSKEGDGGRHSSSNRGRTVCKSTNAALRIRERRKSVTDVD